MPELTQKIQAPVQTLTAAATIPSDTVTVTSSSVDTTMAPTRARSRLASKRAKIFLGVGLFLLIMITAGSVLAFHSYSVVTNLQDQSVSLQGDGRAMYDAFKAQNLPEAKQKLSDLDQRLETFKSTYDQLGYYRYVPVARTYYDDGLHGIAAADAGLRAMEKSLAAIEPYADVLGFSGEGTFTGGTAEDRLKLILQTVQLIAPQLDDISTELNTVEQELAFIDPAQYPESFQGKPIRSYVKQARSLSSGAQQALTQYRPVIERLPSIAGATDEGRRKYLVLFQNDNELRPTGGFLTAYAIINVDNGKVEAEKSDDIYELDKKFNKRLPIPEALGKYLTTESRWNLRDMNVSPDFKTSMDTFFTHYKEVRGEPQNVDGIIAVDTDFLVDLMTIMGEVEVPGYGTFSAKNDPRCDCPQIIYELSNIITRPTPYIREDRKGILGPLMRSLLTMAYTSQRAKLPELADMGFKHIEGRHIQMYFLNEEDQKAAELLGGAGRMTLPQESDYLAIVNSNLGGAKSNLFVESDVLQTVLPPADGKLEKSVEITYRNTRKGDNCNLEAGLLCLNSTLRDWTRLYLPPGTELVSAQGFTDTPQTYEEAGFTVIDGFFILEPNSSAKIKLTYKVPYSDTETYRLTQWKQGGIRSYKMIMDVNGNQEEVLVDKDVTYQAAF